MQNQESDVIARTDSHHINRKRVLITVNPGVIRHENHHTISAIIDALDFKFDLKMATVGDYDFHSKRVRTFKRTRGKFQDLGMLVPEADLWIVYSDGYWLDARTLGFKQRMDFYKAQVDLHYHHLARGNVRRVLNSIDSEQRTLKSWLARFHDDESVIRTYCPSNISDLKDLRREYRTIVAKPSWGGAMMGVVKLCTDADVDILASKIDCDHPYTTIESYCVQTYIPEQVEKRFFVAGGECIGARRLTGRPLPWRPEDNERGYLYEEGTQEYDRDLAAANRILRQSGLTVGSIDFVGTKINELNGGGTVFGYAEGGRFIVDFRERLTDSLLTLIDRS